MRLCITCLLDMAKSNELALLPRRMRADLLRKPRTVAMLDSEWLLNLTVVAAVAPVPTAFTGFRSVSRSPWLSRPSVVPSFLRFWLERMRTDGADSEDSDFFERTGPRGALPPLRESDEPNVLPEAAKAFAWDTVDTHHKSTADQHDAFMHRMGRALWCRQSAPLHPALQVINFFTRGGATHEPGRKPQDT